MCDPTGPTLTSCVYESEFSCLQFTSQCWILLLLVLLGVCALQDPGAAYAAACHYLCIATATVRLVLV